MTIAPSTELLLLSGRSGVGKSTVAGELYHLLAQAEVKHALVEGDNLDLAYPVPWEYGLARKNLRAMWQNFRDLGYRRLIYGVEPADRERLLLFGGYGADSGLAQWAARLWRRALGHVLFDFHASTRLLT